MKLGNVLIVAGTTLMPLAFTFFFIAVWIADRTADLAPAYAVVSLIVAVAVGFITAGILWLKEAGK